MIDRALVERCTGCGFCLPTCPTYELWQDEADSPRGRIHLLQGLLDGDISLDSQTVERFDRCLGCLACTTACPSGVEYDVLIEEARSVIESSYRRPPSERLLRVLLFAVLPHHRRVGMAVRLAPLGRRLPMPSTLRPLVRLAPQHRSNDRPPEHVLAAGDRRGRAFLLLGCVQRALFGSANTATARVLAAEGWEVVAPRDQSCCGALALHAGRPDRATAAARRLLDRLDASDADVLVTNAAGCGSTLKAMGRLLVGTRDAERAAMWASKTRDAAEILAAHPQRSARHPLHIRVAFQDPCHLLHAQGLSAPNRTLLHTVPGLELLEPVDQELCCGSAGIYNLTQPEAAEQLGDRKAAAVASTGPDVYTSANPGCLLQVDAALRRAGHAMPAVHPLEIIDASLRGDAESILKRLDYR